MLERDAAPRCMATTQIQRPMNLTRNVTLAVVSLAAFCGAWSCAAPHPGEVATTAASTGARSLRVVTYNIKHAHGMDGAVDLDRVTDVLRPLDADVILLQEVDHNCVRSGRVDQPVVLGAALDMTPHFGPFRPYDHGLYGMAMLTRCPVERAELVPLPPGPKPINALELQLDFHGQSIIVTGLHLVTTEAQRLAQAQALLARYRDSKVPVILAGDLNSERNSPILEAFAQDFEVPTKQGSPLTFPSVDPIKEIDFVLLSPRDGWAIDEHRVIDEAMASDHRPVLLVAHQVLDGDVK